MEKCTLQRCPFNLGHRKKYLLSVINGVHIKRVNVRENVWTNKTVRIKQGSTEL